ncbi:hypothetical protein [Prosthecobacter sp.]|uniref:hypothetical protein n=1 Tax=Prosthecobacter sp. TaxID=1965333 RepID=UPI0037843E08
MKFASLLLLVTSLVSLTSCAPRPLTAQEQNAIVTAADITLGSIDGYSQGGKAGAVIGGLGALKRDLKTSAKQPKNVTP